MTYYLIIDKGLCRLTAQRFAIFDSIVSFRIELESYGGTLKKNIELERAESMWGVDIFDAQLAKDIRLEFQQAVDGGTSLYIASDRIITKYADADSMVVYLALAALQIEHDVIQPKVKKKALTLINTGDGAERWEDEGNEMLSARKLVLQDLRKRLLNAH